MNLPNDDQVYTLKKVLEDIDFTGLIAHYSSKGRTGYNPIIMYAIVTYANMLGIRSVDRIVELCERDLAFIWIAKGQKPKRDSFYDFIDKRLSPEILENLHYQFIRRLEKEGLITLFIDGTKIEANANHYIFVWRGIINYYLARLLDMIDGLYNEYNALITSNGYDVKYEICEVIMFVIEGMDKVREIIEKDSGNLTLKPHLYE